MQSDEKDLFVKTLENIENTYIALVSSGLQPQQARAILPNALKTELVMTGTIEQWKSFFALRSPKYGAKGVHPDAAKLADELYELIKDRL